jgi:hypothetical protein
MSATVAWSRRKRSPSSSASSMAWPRPGGVAESSRPRTASRADHSGVSGAGPRRTGSRLPQVKARLKTPWLAQ